jgi:predicted membrane metal-binding protein
MELIRPELARIFRIRSDPGRSIISSLAIQAGTMPLSAFFFYQINPFSFLFNILTLPAISIYIILAMAAGFLSILIKVSELKDAASLAAFYSSGSTAPKVEIDYTERKNLKKPPQAKPGYVIYHTNYSMMAEPKVIGVEKVSD